MTDPKFLATFDMEMARHVFRSSTSSPIPMLEKRVANLREAGQVLQSKFQSSVKYLVDSAKGSAQQLLELIISNFSSYDDSFPTEEYVGSEWSSQLPISRICLYKRAQLVIGDIWCCFCGTNPEYRFHDISSLTMFADYRVPQILARFGAIKYSEALLQDMKDSVEMRSGCRREIQIRGCSIHAVELMKEALQVLEAKSDPPPTPEQVPVNSVLIDNFLWSYAKKKEKDVSVDIPIHHVKSIYY